MNGKKPPTIQCHKCKNYFPYYLQKTCVECLKILCPPCTIRYQKWRERFDSSKFRFSFLPKTYNVCATCHKKLLEEELSESEEKREDEETPEWMKKYVDDLYGDSEDEREDENQDSDGDYSDVEAEYERQNKEREKIRAEERARSKYVCFRCGDYSDYQPVHCGGSQKYFFLCEKCGREVCSFCSTTLYDVYTRDGSSRSSWIVCYDCFESVEEEKKKQQEENKKKREKMTEEEKQAEYEEDMRREEERSKLFIEKYGNPEDW